MMILCFLEHVTLTVELIINYLSYVGIGLGILGVILFLYSTKVREFELIGKGNKAAALLLGGKVLSLSVIIGSAIANSVGLMDLFVWGGFGVIVLIFTHALIEL